MSVIKAALIIQNCIAGKFEKNLESSLAFIDSAARMGADFIVFPEMNLTGYVSGPDIQSICRPLDDEIIQNFSHLAKSHGTTIMVGLAEKGRDNHIYASHLIFFPSGSLETYRKIHTAPFEKTYFTAGDDPSVFNSHGLTFGVQLCYDAHFPELSLAMAQKGVDVIFLPHASPRGTSQKKYESWMRHLRARAFDNSVYIAAFNQTGDNNASLFFPGVSVFIGPDGNEISKVLGDSEGVHLVEIDTEIINRIRSHKMKYFLPHRRTDLFKIF